MGKRGDLGREGRERKHENLRNEIFRRREVEEHRSRVTRGEETGGSSVSGEEGRREGDRQTDNRNRSVVRRCNGEGARRPRGGGIQRRTGGETTQRSLKGPVPKGPRSRPFNRDGFSREKGRKRAVVFFLPQVSVLFGKNPKGDTGVVT